MCFFYLVHPCDLPSKAGCEQTCNKDGKSSVCSCAKPDYTLNQDGKSCDKGKLDNAMDGGSVSLSLNSKIPSEVAEIRGSKINQIRGMSTLLSLEKRRNSFIPIITAGLTGFSKT